MAQAFNIDETIISYLDTLIAYRERLAASSPVNVVSLNRAEWIQFITLVGTNFKGCKENTIIDLAKGTSGTYKSILVYYDGSEHDQLNFRSPLYEMQDQLASLSGTNEVSQVSDTHIAQTAPQQWNTVPVQAADWGVMGDTVQVTARPVTGRPIAIPQFATTMTGRF